MDDYLSGEEQVIKARKPYTITKQRERWTDEEHNRFLEALKLYGRAWQRIEEHIGTKTAVQIRSHAQKFFSKLEKEAMVKGVPVAQAIDIEIPPPRPKRKPNTPYPRKTGAISPNTQLQLVDGKQVPTCSSSNTNLDLEKQPFPKETAGSGGKPGGEENYDGETCTETLTLFKDTPNTMEASTDENSVTTTVTASKSRDLKEPVPMEKQVVNNDRCVSPDGLNKNIKDDNPDTLIIAQIMTGNETHAPKNLPRHAPVQILDASTGTGSQTPSSDVSFQESPFHHMGIPCHPGLYPYPPLPPLIETQSSTSRSSNHQPIFHPSFTMLPNIPPQYSPPYMQTFSNLIISTLLQNPAAHAAATFAASYWPPASVESSPHSQNSTNDGVFPHRGMNTGPSVAALAAATVAAATAWWAVHGLLPLCSATSPLVQTEANGNDFHDPPHLQVQNVDREIPKSSETSSSDSGSDKKKLVTAGDNNNNEDDVSAMMTEKKEVTLSKSKKQVDRSSCGSNTPSGSDDVETDALQKKDEGDEQLKEPDCCHPANETGVRRSRVVGCVNDSWKEVSQGGRLAFQALFSRERLPQSFSPPHEDPGINSQTKDGADINTQNAAKNNEDTSKLDLNCNTWVESRFKDHQVFDKDGLLTIGLQGKLKARKTGFKPYKRCSVEARESTINSTNQGEEKSCKRIRLEGEGEASI